MQHCNRIGGNGLGQNLLKCRWILGFAHFQVLVIGACFCCSSCNTAVHLGVKNTHFGVKNSQFSYKNALFWLIFLSLLFRKKEMFFVIFHPKLAKNKQKQAKISPKSGKVVGVFCYSSTVATVHFGVIHTHFVRENNQFSYKIALFWLMFSLFFFAEKINFCRNFSHKILCNLAKLSTKFRNRHRVFCCSAAVAAVHFGVIHIPFLSYLQIHIKISISNS